ncbi:MAG: sulfotransferase family protein [Immundisolibacter sp.]|uniref:sulfotransferase family protein n=1 Tax=Immundisolibacter sp. TaxID=1934948 RepID=UPI003EDF7DFD
MFPKLVFLVGVPRSGTTWLQLLLSQSTHVATVNETHLFSHYTRSLFESWVHFQSSARGSGLHDLMGEEDFIAKVRVFTDDILKLIEEKKSGASVVLEKTPAHAWAWKDILKVYPDACFIHLIRDPRAVVASLRAAGRDWGKNWASTSVVENAETWLRVVELARSIKKESSKYLEVRYEDLMRQPVESIETMFDWLGISESKEVCRSFVDLCKPDKLSKGAANTAWDTSKEPKGFFRGAGVDGWRNDLSTGEIAEIERVTAPLASILGYSPARARLFPSARELSIRAVNNVDRWWEWQRKKILKRL